MNIAEFSIRNKVLCAIVIILALISGYSSYESMARLEDPEFTIRKAQVITYYPGATPLEVAQELSEPIESAIQQMTEVKSVKSVSSAGKSEILVEIKYKFSKNKSELQAVWGKLRNKVSDVSGTLPTGSSAPIVADDFGDLFGMYFFIYGDEYTLPELRTYAKTLRNDLMSINGVARVDISGEANEAIYVKFSRERMLNLGVSIQSIYQSLETQNLVVNAGEIDVAQRRIAISPSGSINSVDSISDILVKTSDLGNLVYLGDVAEVTRELVKPEERLYYFNGHRALALGLSATSGENIVEVGKAVNKKISDTLNVRPLGIDVSNYYHQGESVEASINNFALNVVMALAIVIVTLFIFMGIRSALIIGSILLLTIAATLAVMNLAGIPMHRISLGALIIALGMMVDNAIVVAEGMLIGIKKGLNRLEVAKSIVAQTQWPLLAGTLVGCVAFAPIGFAPGDIAEFTGHLFWVILISLLFSWLFAITITPLLCYSIFKTDNSFAIQKEGRLTLSYKKLMRTMLNHRWKVSAVVVAMFMSAVYGFGFVKDGFFAASTTPQFVVDFWLPESTSINQTDKEIKKVAKYVESLPGVNTIQTSVGAGGLRYMLVYSPQSPNSSYAQLLVKVDDYQTIRDKITKVQRHIDTEFPDAQAKVWQFQLGPGGGSKIQAEFFGPDPKVLRRLANEAKAIMHRDSDAISIKDDWRDQVSVLEPILSKVKAKRAGVTIQDVALAIKTAYSGRQIGSYRDGEDIIPIISTSPDSEFENPDDIYNIQVISSTTGNIVPLRQVVDGFKTIWRDGRMKRDNRIWRIKAEADPKPGVLASVLLNRLSDKIEAIELPTGYTLEWGGEYRDSKESNENIGSTLPYGFAAMVIIVFVLFGSVRQPLVIWMVVPLAIIGVVIGLLSAGMPLEFMGILGLLSLSGLLIKNAIVLVDQIDLEINDGKPRFTAIVDAATSRVRPVTMGALTTVLGLVPLYFDAFFKSMSVVLGFGLTFATILTLIIVPVLYAIMFRVKATEV